MEPGLEASDSATPREEPCVFKCKHLEILNKQFQCVETVCPSAISASLAHCHSKSSHLLGPGWVGLLGFLARGIEDTGININI